MNAITKVLSVAVLVALGLEPGATAAEVYVADIPWTNSTPGVRENMAPPLRPGPDIPIKIGTVTYAKGMGTMTDQPRGRKGFESSVVVDIAGKGYRSFSADVGDIAFR